MSGGVLGLRYVRKNCAASVIAGIKTSPLQVYSLVECILLVSNILGLNE